MASKCESSNDAGQTQTAVEVKSFGFASKPVTATASCGVPGKHLSMKKKNGRPLSAHCGQRLIVKGFTFFQKCKRVRKMESGCINGDGNGSSKKAFVVSEMVLSPNTDIQESLGVERCAQAQKTPVDGLVLNDENTSVMRKCGQKMERHCDHGHRVRMAKACKKSNNIVGDSVYTYAIVARRRGRPRKRPLVGASLTDNSISVIMKNNLQENRNANAVVARKRGRPRKILIGENANEIGKTDGLDKEKEEVRSSTDANVVVVRKRGRPRKIPIGVTSVIGVNMSIAAKFGEHIEHQSENTNEVVKTDGLEKEKEEVRSPTDTNVEVVRRRGRPRKIPIDVASVIHVNMSEATKCGEQDEHWCENANEVGKTD